MSYWTQTSTYGNIEIIWEYKETEAKETAIIHIPNE